MAVILQIESASKNCSIAVSNNGKTVACIEESGNQYVHSEKLHLFIEEVLKESNLSFKDLDAIAVGKGPGSYTGLRIGVSAAKGLCFALGIPLISIDSLSVLAASVFNKVDGAIVPMLDARRMEVYTCMFSPEGTLLKDIEAKIIDENSYLEELEKRSLFFIGDGSEKVKSVIKHENAHFLDVTYPSAKSMSELSFTSYKSKKFEDLAYFEPFYLKDFVAGKPKRLL